MTQFPIQLGNTLLRRRKIADLRLCLCTGADPYLDGYKFKIASGGSTWTVAAGNRYTATYASLGIANVGYLRQQGQYLSNRMKLVTSTALVESTVRSFFYDGTTIHINAGAGINPNTLAWEIAPASTVSAVGVSADLTAVRDIRADGWGLHSATASTGSNTYIFMSSPGTNGRTLFQRCSAYDGGRHNIGLAHSGQTGCVAVFDECESGGTKYSTDGETTYVAFCDDLVEGYYRNCRSIGGTLPHSAFSIPRSEAFFAHCAGSGVVGMFISLDCHVTTSEFPNLMGSAASFLPQFADDPTACRVWVISETQLSGGTSAIYGSAMAGGRQAIFLNCDHRVKPLTASSGVFGVVNTVIGTWAVNCYVQVDLRSMGSAASSSGYFFFGTAAVGAGVHSFKWLNCHFDVMLKAATNFAVEATSYFNGAGKCANCEVFNTIFSKHPSSDGTSLTIVPAMTNSATVLKNIAGFGMNANWTTGAVSGAGNAANKVTLASHPLHATNAIFRNGSYIPRSNWTDVAEAAALQGAGVAGASYKDRFGRLRASPPTIGPWEWGDTEPTMLGVGDDNTLTVVGLTTINPLTVASSDEDKMTIDDSPASLAAFAEDEIELSGVESGEATLTVDDAELEIQMLPAVSDVRAGVDRGDGQIGTLDIDADNPALLPVTDVRSGVDRGDGELGTMRTKKKVLFLCNRKSRRRK